MPLWVICKTPNDAMHSGTVGRYVALVRIDIEMCKSQMKSVMKDLKKKFVIMTIYWEKRPRKCEYSQVRGALEVEELITARFTTLAKFWNIIAKNIFLYEY